MNLRLVWLAGRWGQIVTFLAICWVVFMIFVILPMTCSVTTKRDNSELEPFDDRLARAFVQMRSLKKQNEELKTLFSESNLK